ncbi:hypothetical protein L7A47_30955, partial [Achromobacter xylosoxidans]|nr:hypothetical protein [Achromobacter xylosoxidans]
HFVKHIIGDQTAPGTLVNGTYNYAGVTFSNFPRGRLGLERGRQAQDEQRKDERGGTLGAA